jgi:hypothetical protein
MKADGEIKTYLRHPLMACRNGGNIVFLCSYADCELF